MHISFSFIIPAVLSMNTFDEVNRSLECLLPCLLIDRERGHYSLAEYQLWSPLRAK